MKKIYFLFFFILFNSYITTGQVVSVQIKVNQLGINYSTGHREPRWIFFYNGANINAWNACFQADDHNRPDKSKYQYWYPSASNGYNSYYLLNAFNVNLNSPGIYINLEGWEENSSADDKQCTYNNADEWYSNGSLYINLINTAPFAYSSSYGIYVANHSAVIQVKYTPPAPSKPTSPLLTEYGKNCGAEELQTISTSTNLPNKTGLTYNWEYFTEGDSIPVQNPAWCYWDWDNPYPGPYPEPIEALKFKDGPNDPPPCAYKPQYIYVPRWRSLGQTASPSVQFIPTQLLSSGITQDTTIHFRVKLGSTLSSDQSINSNEVIYQFSPPAPKIKPEDITTIPSCPAIGSGQINIAAIQGAVKNYTYILKRGFNKIYTCDPEGQIQASPCLTDVEKWGKINTSSNPNVSITDVKAGQYTLMILNAGINKGVCFNTYNVEVTEYPPLQIIASKIEKEISCADASDGEISLKTSGGNINPLIFSISPALGNLAVNGRNTLYTGLPAGTYTVTVKDECGQEQSQLHTIAPVTKVSGMVSSINPVCSSPSNGQITINADHGSGNYDLLFIKRNKYPGY